ncbi:hypothetical protein [Photobacterium rosenbergii]|uniref:Capsule biosynthesis protein n=1 Tax=Photobacterium rosenbergii TaxID=294936 RepID=A0ABU3ZQ35_9GAMM|nr:hypothetical protein [Photobacterium rosenbergii]MDV5172134.1 hypothetical protein [Photobacterium rosenbergii]
MKTLYVMCFYESNARYFHHAIEQFKKNNIDLIFLCMYPSAVGYCRRNNLKYINLPHKVRKQDKNGFSEKLTSKAIKECYSFHHKLLPFSHEKYTDLVKQYYNFYMDAFQKEECLGAVVIGDVRLFSSTATLASYQCNKKIVYFEPGPFGTMIFDDSGVNKNMTISSISDECISSHVLDKTKLSDFYEVKSVNQYYKGSISAYIRKIPDVFLSIPPKLIKASFPIELQTGESFYDSIPYLFSRIKKPRQNKIANARYNGKYIFFPLQVPCDVQIVMNSPYFDSILQMVKSVAQSIPDGYKLVLREHPMNLGRYGSSFYSYIESNDKIILDNSNNIWELVKASELVVVNNSTVGIESLKYNTEVLVLGDAFYHKAVHVFNGEGLKDKIHHSINNPISREYKDKYLSLLYENYLIKDNYKNESYINLGLMVNKISNFYA